MSSQVLLIRISWVDTQYGGNSQKERYSTLERGERREERGERDIWKIASPIAEQVSIKMLYSVKAIGSKAKVN